MLAFIIKTIKNHDSVKFHWADHIPIGKLLECYQDSL